MKPKKMKNAFRKVRLLLAALVAVASLTAMAHAAAPGITGPSFNLTAQAAYITQPDGQAIYSWGYGCSGTRPDLYLRRFRLARWLSLHADPGPDAHGHGRRQRHGNVDQRSSRSRRQHLDPVPWIPGDDDGRHFWFAGAGSGRTRRNRNLHALRPPRQGRTPTTAERKAICRSKWGSTGR